MKNQSRPAPLKKAPGRGGKGHRCKKMVERNRDNEYKRDWNAQNNAPAMLAAALLDIGWLGGIKAELSRMNEGKAGRPFEYGDMMVATGMMIKAALDITWRLVHGFLTAFLALFRCTAIGATQFYERGVAMAADAVSTFHPGEPRIIASGTAGAVPRPGKIIAAADATGITYTNNGGWIAERWNSKKIKGWIKLHTLVNTATNEILAFVVSGEDPGNITALPRLVKLAVTDGHGIDRLYADAAYDSRHNWAFCREEYGIEFLSNIKNSASGKFRGSSARGIQVLRRKEIGETAWKIEIGYRRRWKVECTFSDLKRLLGDCLAARERETMAYEVFWMLAVFNLYKSILINLRERNLS